MRTLFAALFLLGALASRSAVPAQDEKPLGPANLAVNTAADEDEPHWADAGTTLYYASNAGKKMEIYVAKRKSATGPWGKGKAIEAFGTGEGDDRACFATAGGYPRYLYYSTKSDRKADNFDLFFLVKNDARAAAWTARAPLQKLCTEVDEMHPWIAADGKSLYFSRRDKDGWRVYVAKRKVATGPLGWDEGEAVEGLPVGFHHATLAPDGRTMYLQGPLEDRRSGLFVSSATRAGWSKPAPLTRLNAGGKTGDRSPNLSRDGKWLYFASDRPGGKGGLDLYVISTVLLAGKK